MDVNEDEISLDKVIDELDAIEYKTVAEKAKAGFEEFYSKFREQFGKMEDGSDADSETKKEMVIATYSMALQALDNALQALEYSYTLTMSIEKVQEEQGLNFNEYVDKAIAVSNEFIGKLANNTDLTINEQVNEILKEIQEKGDLYE